MSSTVKRLSFKLNQPQLERWEAISAHVKRDRESRGIYEVGPPSASTVFFFLLRRAELAISSGQTDQVSAPGGQTVIARSPKVTARLEHARRGPERRRR